jgi:hypothetical protein
MVFEFVACMQVWILWLRFPVCNCNRAFFYFEEQNAPNQMTLHFQDEDVLTRTHSLINMKLSKAVCVCVYPA